MVGVLEKRRELLRLMRDITLENGFFTIPDIAEKTAFPRSTVQDWINRLLEERCIAVKEEKKGRIPAKFMTSSAMLSSACKRIFTTVDESTVAIFHECMSAGCAAFCAHHHTRAEGMLNSVCRDGTLLLEYASLGQGNADVGLYPKPAVGIASVQRDGSFIIQKIRCIGGPAYSLTDMMATAEGVCGVRVTQKDGIVEGEVKTKALEHMIIGVDDTDSPEGGATFALALGLLQYLGKFTGVIPIGHHVAMLWPEMPGRTAGNSCSMIELGVEPELFGDLAELAVRFIATESLSPEWGIAIKKGFLIDKRLRQFSINVRKKEINIAEAQSIAESGQIMCKGGEGIIGALAAVGMRGQESSILLDPKMPLEKN